MGGWRRRLRPPESAPDPGAPSLGERDAILITYPDHLTSPDSTPLSCLASFLTRAVSGAFSGAHILPFFPSSSDDGFSVIDYRAVDPRLGSWRDVETIGRKSRLMVDLVLNHASVGSRWFKGFLGGNRRYADFFIPVEPGTDLSGVFRPRARPLVTPFPVKGGQRLLWTTFSEDQVDLNYRDPDVLLEMVDVMLGYAARGAQLIRLDAVAFLWKEAGTSCVHLPETHAIVRLLRSVVEEVCPWVLLVSETNVPHDLNVSYLGSGNDEAHMIYNFSLPPLLMDAFSREDAGTLSAWAAELRIPRGGTLLNFLSSHDGIGLVPARGYLSPGRIADLSEMTRKRGGFVSMRTEAAAGGPVETPYELNIPWMDAVSDPGLDDETRARKLVTSQRVMLSLAGVPAVYINTLLGTPADRETALRLGHPRATNRRKLDLKEVLADITQRQVLGALVFRELERHLSVRRSHRAFHPAGAQEIVRGGGSLFSVLRTAPDRSESVLCMHNLGHRNASLVLAGGLEAFADSAEDIMTGRKVPAARNAETGSLSFELGPWESRWAALRRV